MINKFTYKEVDHANAILESGFLTHYRNYEMSLLCKLWKENGLPKKEAKTNLEYFCQLYIEGYDELLYYRSIERAVNKVYQNDSKLTQIDYVPIYRHEIEYINSVAFKHPYKRLLFAMLVLKKIHSSIWHINGGEEKLSGYLSGDQKQLRTVKEMAHLGSSKKDNINYMIYDLSQVGIVTTLALAKVYLNFIDEVKDLASEEVLRVSDFEHVWMYYDCIAGYNRAGRIIICKECGKPLIVKNKAPQRYCGECAKRVKNAQNKAYREAKNTSNA